MREIKFRGKIVEAGSWVYGCLIYNLDPTKEENIIREAFIRTPLGNLSESFRVLPDSIGQYTGLKDKNGVEIYSGDKIANDTGRICKVVWNEYHGQWDALPINGNGLPIKFETNNWKYLRVIGSIYEQQKGDTK